MPIARGCVPPNPSVSLPGTVHDLWDYCAGIGDYTKLYLTLECAVNDGSPSGFHPQANAEYLPRLNHPGFELGFYPVGMTTVTVVGPAPPWVPQKSDPVLIPVHPEFTHGKFGDPEAILRVLPTSSVRTVAHLDAIGRLNGFIKLHFPRELGRFSRDLHHYKWLASLEADRALEQASHVDRNTCFLREQHGWFYEPEAERGWGALVRTLPNDILTAGALIPAFSLLSRSADARVLDQLRQRHGWEGSDAIDQLGLKTVALYVRLATYWGLIPEFNAQNLLFSIRPDGSAVPVMRDMGDIFKDLVIRSAHGHSTSFGSYKSLTHLSSDLYERRSFAYDFKLGKYFLAPLADAVARTWGLTLSYVERTLLQGCRLAWAAHQGYFREEQIWYGYAQSRGVSRDMYVANRNPEFR